MGKVVEVSIFWYGFNIVGFRGKDKIITINVFSAFLTLFGAIDKEFFLCKIRQPISIKSAILRLFLTMNL